ncbi:helix-turn-helix domain-containing protein [Nocardia sp. NPDC058518]|uniref:TetR/AcrR family transcriptional regulator n=1 Tax=Nocardia sp. NPDC058518 TaxID=3346534 RepID=UPI00366370ED
MAQKSGSAHTEAAPDQPGYIDPSSDRRTRSRQRRRNEVYAAAVELFIDRGFDRTTIDEIAERADVARASVFNYFPRKTAFLDEWTARRRARATAVTTAVAGETLDQLLHRYMTEMAKISEETRDETRAMLSATLQQTNFLANPELADELAALIRNGRDAGAAPAYVNAEQVGLILATAYFAVLARWITPDTPEFDLERELLMLVDTVLYGAYSPRQAEPRRP